MTPLLVIALCIVGFLALVALNFLGLFVMAARADRDDAVRPREYGKAGL